MDEFHEQEKLRAVRAKAAVELADSVDETK